MERMAIFENALLAKGIDIRSFQPTPQVERNPQSSEGSRGINVLPNINASPNINISPNLSTNIHIGTTSNPLPTNPNPIDTPAPKKHRKSLAKRIRRSLNLNTQPSIPITQGTLNALLQSKKKRLPPK